MHRPLKDKDSCLTQGSSSHYQVLRIPVTATEKEIKVAYRRAARKAHPDHGGDPAAFRRVTLAYETLIDAKRRADYDRSYGSFSGPGRHRTAAGAALTARPGREHALTPRRPAATPRRMSGGPTHPGTRQRTRRSTFRTSLTSRRAARCP